MSMTYKIDYSKWCVKPWMPGDIVTISEDLYTWARSDAGFGVPFWDRAWRNGDPSIGGHLKLGYIKLGSRVLVLHIDNVDSRYQSAMIISDCGRIGYLHADDIALTGSKKPLATL